MFRETRAMFLVVALAATVQFATGAGAANNAKSEANAVVIQMNTYLCKDIMRLESDDRAVALGLLHGYFMGKAGSTTYDPRKIGKISDDFVEYCLDHPSEKAFDRFAKFVK